MRAAAAATVSNAHAIADGAGRASRAVLAMVRSFQSGRGAANRRSGVQGAAGSNPISRTRVCGGNVLAARHCFDCHSRGSLLDLLELVNGRAVLHGALESDHSGLFERLDDDTTGFGEPADGIRSVDSSVGAAVGGSWCNRHVSFYNNRCGTGRE